MGSGAVKTNEHELVRLWEDRTEVKPRPTDEEIIAMYTNVKVADEQKKEATRRVEILLRGS